jgi:Domain of unknown function (DUF4352)
MRIGGWLLILAVFALQSACVKSAPPPAVYRMGEKVKVGPVIYNIFEAKWRAQVGEGPEVRTPTHRFLIVHLSATNSGAEILSMPSLKLTDEAGQTYNESMEGQGIQSWLGMVRKLKPADTMEGNIVFDLEPKYYKLRLEDESSSDLAMVEIPLQFDAEKPNMPSLVDTPAQ